MIKIVAVVTGVAIAGVLVADTCRRVVEGLNPSPKPPTVSCAKTNRASGDLSSSSNLQLQKLAEYEKVCGGVFADRLMLFAPTPPTAEEAVHYADDLASVLKQFAAFSVSPLVVLEPVAADGKILDLQAYSGGAYDQALTTYFQHLKSQGVTDEQMGMWAVMPEANTPVWRTTSPEHFVANVAKTVSLQKHYFPTSKATILLNSLSYPDNDEHWQHGSFKSLEPYISKLPKGLLDSFGYQGFPWSPPADSSGTDLKDADIFLRDDLAREAARILNVDSVWLNTGTFRQSYAGQPNKTITVSPEERARILAGVVNQAKKIQQDNLVVAVHVFAEDKSQLAERVDWSYWQTGKPENSSATPVFKQFVSDTQKANIALWLYDTLPTNH